MNDDYVVLVGKLENPFLRMRICCWWRSVTDMLVGRIASWCYSLDPALTRQSSARTTPKLTNATEGRLSY